MESTDPQGVGLQFVEHDELTSPVPATALRCHFRAAGYDVAPFRPLEAEVWLAGRATHFFRKRGSLRLPGYALDRSAP